MDNQNINTIKAQASTHLANKAQNHANVAHNSQLLKYKTPN